jgi:hypothetical protein
VIPRLVALALKMQAMVASGFCVSTVVSGGALMSASPSCPSTCRWCRIVAT